MTQKVQTNHLLRLDKARGTLKYKKVQQNNKKLVYCSTSTIWKQNDLMCYMLVQSLLYTVCADVY